MGRAPCCDKANVKKGPWSPEEDSKLKEYIDKHGTGGNWIALPQKAGLRRCGKSCRLRWLNYLRPNIKHGEFSDEEDRIICTLYSNIGSRWSIIAGQLPGRTDNDIKNYWNTKLKKKLMGLLPSSHHRIKPSYVHSSTPQNPPLPPFHSHYNYHNSSSSPNTCLEPISSSSCYNNNTTTNSMISSQHHQHPFYQNQLESSLVTTGCISPMQMMQYYPMSTAESVVMFGSTTTDQGSCCSSSDGKQEEMIMGFQNFMYNSNKNNSMLSHNNSSINNDVCFSEKQTALDYDLEVIKQLICSNSSSSSYYYNSCNNNGGYDHEFSVDENKMDEKKSMYSYYY